MMQVMDVCRPWRIIYFMGRCCGKNMAGVALILSAGFEVPTHPEHLHSNPNKLRKNPGDSPQGSTFPSRVVRNLNKLNIRITLRIWMQVGFCLWKGHTKKKKWKILISEHCLMKILTSKMRLNHKSDKEQVTDGWIIYDLFTILTFGGNKRS